MKLPSIIKGDITRVEVDAIVNAANEWMLGGGGVDGAIHHAAGPELYVACKAVPEITPGIRCPVGEARITPGFDLPAKFVIHTVGPRWKGGLNNEEEMLAKCYRNSLALAANNNIVSIAFPLISTGAFAFPHLPACRRAIVECSKHLDSRSLPSEITLVAHSGEDFASLKRAWREFNGV